jgi:predicted RNA methylase
MSSFTIELNQYFGVMKGMKGTSDSLFSSETDCHIKQIHNVVFKHSLKSIVDATAHIGGFTIPSALFNPQISFLAIEKDPNVFSLLQNNVNQIVLPNVKMFNESFVRLRAISCDAIYMDPPWGGRNYKENEFMSLFLDEINIVQLIVPDKKYFIKVPLNYRFQDLKDNEFTVYTLHTIKNYEGNDSFYLIELDTTV